MSNNPSERSSSIDTGVEDAQAARLRAETRKLEAEAAKIELERDELELPWYRRAIRWQTVAVIFTLGPLFFFYFKEFVLPVAKADNIKLSLELQETQMKLKAQIDALTKKSTKLNNERNTIDRERKLLKQELTSLAGQRATLQTEKVDISRRYDDLTRQYRELAANMSISSTARSAYSKRASALDQESAELRAENEKFKRDFAKLSEERELLKRSVAEMFSRLETQPATIAINQNTLRDLSLGKAKFEEAREVNYTRFLYVGKDWKRGTAKTRVLIGTNGEVLDARLIQVDPAADPVTRAAIIDFVRGVRYAPATVNGTPISVWLDNDLDDDIATFGGQ